jgi:uncharacterized protein YcbX
VSGIRDVDTLKALNSRGHQDFGVYAIIKKAGILALGDKVEIL